MRKSKHQRATQNADQAEFESVKSGSCPLDQGIYDERVADDLEDHYGILQISTSADWQEIDMALDNAVGETHKEIKRRIDLMGEAYPFQLQKNSLKYVGQKTRLYEFLLLISNTQKFNSKRKKILPRLFERITAKLVSAYFGKHAQSFHMGWPRDGGTSFQEAWRQVERKTNEFVWKPEHGQVSSKEKDAGCDFAICLPHDDKRKIGQLFILGQCACGNNWETKFEDMKYSKLKKWFHPMTIIPPINAFTVPHHVTNFKMKEVSRLAGLFFDRARLTMILEKSKNEILDQSMKRKIEDCISEGFESNDT